MRTHQTSIDGQVPYYTYEYQQFSYENSRFVHRGNRRSIAYLQALGTSENKPTTTVILLQKDKKK